MTFPLLFALLTLLTLPLTLSQGPPLRNTFNYHTTVPPTARSFQGVYGSNFNETITFCNHFAKSFEVFSWKAIPVIAQSADSGQSRYNDKGALLYGTAYVAANGSVTWKGAGLSANGVYDAAFALAGDGKVASGYFTFLPQQNGSTPAGETGPWMLYYRGEPTKEACELVYRCYTGREDY